MKKTLGLLCFALIGVDSAWAINVQRFRPSYDTTGSVVSLGSKIEPKGSWSTGAFLNWVRNPIEFGLTTNDSQTDNIVNWFMTADFLFTYSFSDRFQIGANMPMNVLGNIEPIGTITTEKDFAVGDLMILGKYAVVQADQEEGNLGFAILPFVTAPTGDQGRFFGSENVTGGFRLLLDWWPGSRHYFTLNVGPQFREKETILNLTVAHELTGSVGYRAVLSEKYGWDFLLDAYGSTVMESFGQNEIQSPWELLAGFQKRWKDGRWKLTMGGGRGMNNGYGSPDARAFVGLTYTDRPVVVKASPPPPPPPPSLPQSQLTVRVVDKAQKLMLAQIEVKKGTGELIGQERSHELVEKLEAGEYVIGVAADGYYPVGLRVQLDEGAKLVEVVTLERIQKIEKIELLGKVLFDLDKATIKPESYPVLNHVVSVLRTHPEIKKVRVDAHTDSQGSETYNLDLSKRRARSVVVYVTAGGIDEKRLTSEGYGESKPVDTNKTRAGRANNRRVEFKILEIDMELAFQNDERVQAP